RPQPVDSDGVAVLEHRLDVEALIGKRRPRDAYTLLVGGEVERVAVPRIAGIVMDGVIFSDEAIAGAGLTRVPDAIEELGENGFAVRYFHPGKLRPHSRRVNSSG